MQEVGEMDTEEECKVVRTPDQGNFSPPRNRISLFLPTVLWLEGNQRYAYLRLYRVCTVLMSVGGKKENANLEEMWYVEFLQGDGLDIEAIGYATW